MVAYGALGIHDSLVFSTNLASVSKNGTYITPEQERFSQRVAEAVGDAGVLNNFNDASVFLYPIYGVNAALKGRRANQMSSMSDDLCLVIEHIDKVAGNDALGLEVRTALDRLGIQYVVKMSDSPNMTTQMNELAQIEYEEADAILSVTDATPGFSLVLEEDGMQLFRIDAGS